MKNNPPMDDAEKVEMQAANRAYKAGFGVGEWESFLNKEEIAQLKEFYKKGLGTWAREGKIPQGI